MHVYLVDFGSHDIRSTHRSETKNAADARYIKDLAVCLSVFLVLLTNTRVLEFHDAPLALQEDQRTVYMDTVVSKSGYVPLQSLWNLKSCSRSPMISDAPSSRNCPLWINVGVII